MNYFDCVYDLFPLDHDPMPPYPRTGNVREKIYSTLWKHFMRREVPLDAPGESNFIDVLNHFGYQIEQRHASVVASVVCWFGTNCGQAFLDETEELGKILPAGKFENRYLMNWATDNMRLSYLNGAKRTIEGCTDGATGFELSVSDFEAVECLMYWLGTKDGQMFLTIAREESEIAYAREREAIRLNFLRNR